MSFFYASPVEGEMHLYDLETAVADRVRFLRTLVIGGELKYSEFLLEGTAYDNAGHFTLCIVTILADNPYLTELVRNGEIKLFERRLSYLNPSTLRLFAKKLLTYVKRNLLTERYTEVIFAMCTKMSLAHIAEHICSEHSQDCTRHAVTVHFTLCLPFVSNRKVELKAGQATIPCGLWLRYLTIIFQMHLNTRNQFRKQLEVFRTDSRIMSIVAEYISYGRNQTEITSKCTGALFSRDVDDKSQYFPPCMQTLHNAIRKHHRLSHDQRFYYTCFLKDIGMPVSEAVQFWKEEYSKNSCTSSCRHTWASDGAKYVRGIRHMYGLEGSRTSYSCAGCRKIQGQSSSGTAGGCPFKTFSDDSMKSLLHPDFTKSSQLMATVYKCRANGHFNKACKFYLMNTFPEAGGCGDLKLQEPLFLTPVKFYTLAKNYALSN